MVQVLLRLTAPPGRLQQTLHALQSVMLPVRLERGEACAHLCSEHKNVVCYFEEWPDIDQLNEQVRSPRFRQILALMETAAEEPRLEFRFVSDVRGLDYVAEVRGDPALVTIA